MAVGNRGAVRGLDALELRDLHATMRVEWIARELHPWERARDPRVAGQLFAQQCLRDVDAAIARLFDQLPEVDALEIRVLREVGGLVLFEGLVERHEPALVQHLSPRMKLKSIGVRFHMSDGRLEPLSAG